MEDRIEIYLLEHLEAMADCRTLAEASEKLNISQPTLTRSIQKIEKILGVTLFTRERNRMYLNENGKAAVDYASRILALDAEMIRYIRFLDQSSKMISVGSCTPGPLLNMVGDLQAMHPDIKIVSEVKMPDQLISGLESNEYQMIILNYPIRKTGYLCSFWGTEKLFISLVPDHPLASRQSLSFAEINSLNMPVVSNLGIWRSIIEDQMPDSEFYAQSDLNVLGKIANASTFPVFDSDARINLYGANKNRLTIPISDKKACLECYCVCKVCDRKLFPTWFPG